MCQWLRIPLAVQGTLAQFLIWSWYISPSFKIHLKYREKETTLMKLGDNFKSTLPCMKTENNWKNK